MIKFHISASFRVIVCIHRFITFNRLYSQLFTVPSRYFFTIGIDNIKQLAEYYLLIHTIIWYNATLILYILFHILNGILPLILQISLQKQICQKIKAIFNYILRKCLNYCITFSFASTQVYIFIFFTLNNMLKFSARAHIAQ